MRVPLCGLGMRNMDWAKKIGTWKSTKNRTSLPLELDDDQVHYVGRFPPNNISASFYCMYFFNIVRHHISFKFSTNRPISSLLFWWSVAKKLESLSEVRLFWSLSHWNACAHFKLEHWPVPFVSPQNQDHVSSRSSSFQHARSKWNAMQSQPCRNSGTLLPSVRDRRIYYRWWVCDEGGRGLRGRFREGGRLVRWGLLL